MLDAFQLQFMQRAALEIALLAPLAGLLGAQIVLRRLAFFTHSLGAATFPGLVVAGPLGIAPQAAALGAGLGFAAALGRARRLAGGATDVATALILVGALAAGVVLASDVLDAGAAVDQLLLGSLIAVGPGELAASAAALALVALAAAVFRRAWIATGFDPAAPSTLGLRARLADTALVAAIAVAVVASLDAAGALLVGAILVIPAATARLLATSVRALELGAAALALAEGLAGLWIAYLLDAPPGPTIAVVGGAVFALVALTSGVRGPHGGRA